MTDHQRTRTVIGSQIEKIVCDSLELSHIDGFIDAEKDHNGKREFYEIKSAMRKIKRHDRNIGYRSGIFSISRQQLEFLHQIDGRIIFVINDIDDNLLSVYIVSARDITTTSVTISYVENRFKVYKKILGVYDNNGTIRI